MPRERAASTNSCPFQLHRLRPDNTRQRQPAQSADGDEQGNQPGHGAHHFHRPARHAGNPLRQPPGRLLHGQGKNNHQHNERQGKKHIHQAHHQGIQPASGITGNQSVRHANHQGNARSDHSHQQGNAAAVQDTRQQVPPKLVRAEPMVPGRAFRNPGQILHIRMRQPRQQGTQKTGRRNQRQRQQGKHGRPVAGKTQKSVLPQGGTLFLHPVPSSFSHDSFLNLGLTAICTRSTPRLAATIRMP